jgi:hypothetical protein
MKSKYLFWFGMSLAVALAFVGPHCLLSMSWAKEQFLTPGERLVKHAGLLMCLADLALLFLLAVWAICSFIGSSRSQRESRSYSIEI